MTDFLYPFIEAQETDVDALLADLAASARDKARESAALQAATLQRYSEDIAACAADLADRFTDGGRLYAFGNGGSSTDCAAFVELFGSGRPLPAFDLTADQAVVTALGNDVGFDLIFSRQLIAHSAGRDIAAAFSTSGNSTDLMTALREAGRRGLLTIGFAGYDGGAMATAGLDHCFVVESQSVHRIQETQALLGHAIWQATQQLMTGVPA